MVALLGVIFRRLRPEGLPLGPLCLVVLSDALLCFDLVLGLPCQFLPGFVSSARSSLNKLPDQELNIRKLLSVSVKAWFDSNGVRYMLVKVRDCSLVPAILPLHLKTTVPSQPVQEKLLTAVLLLWVVQLVRNPIQSLMGSRNN